MWRKFLGDQARIIGIDIEQSAVKWRDFGFEIYIGDQSNPAFWRKFFAEVGPVDILIDDGSHHCSHQITTLQKVWPHITQGGVYLCEDTHTNYWPEYGGGMTNHTTFLNYSKLITDTMNREYYRGQDLHPNNTIFADYYKEVVGMHYYDSIVVLDKNQRSATKLITSTPI